MALQKRDRRHLLALMTSQGRSREEMALELAGRENTTPMVAFRYMNDWSQEQAADAYNARLRLHAADRGHLTRQRLGKLENWPAVRAAPPSLTELVALAALYRTTPRNLLAPEAIGLLPSPKKAAVSEPREDSQLHRDALVDRAADAAQAAIGDPASGPGALGVSDLALCRVILAKARLLKPYRDVEGAYEVLRPVLQLGRRDRGTGLELEVVGVRNLLAAPDIRGSRLATDLIDAIGDFLGGPPAGALR